MRLFSAPPLLGTGATAASTAPYWAETLGQWDFKTSLADQRNYDANDYDIALAGTASRDGTDGLILPGGASDTAQTNDDFGDILPQSDFAYEVFGIRFDTVPSGFAHIMAVNDAPSLRGFEFRANNASTFFGAAYRSNSAAFGTVSNGSNFTTSGEYYAGMFRVGDVGYVCIGEMGSTCSVASFALTGTTDQRSLPLHFGRRGNDNDQRMVGKIAAARITASARGMDGTAFTPDSLPLAT